MLWPAALCLCMLPLVIYVFHSKSWESLQIYEYIRGVRGSEIHSC